MEKRIDRKLIDGRTAAEGEIISLTIETRCPSKWLFVDLEAGDVWRYYPDREFKFYSATPTDLHTLAQLLRPLKTLPAPTESAPTA